MLRNRKFITCLLIGFFAVFNVFSQSDMTFALVEKYATKAVLIDGGIMTQGTPDEVFKSKDFLKIFGYPSEGGKTNE